MATGGQLYSEQAPVTAWPARLALTVAVIAFLALVCWAMARNWRKRIDRQSWVQLPPPPAEFGADGQFDARYVATVTTEDWLDRIAAQGLGAPGSARVLVGAAGLLIERAGEHSLYVPSESIVEAANARGMAQEVYERDGLVAVTWRSGDRLVTTGLRMAGAQDHLALLAALENVLGRAEA